MVFSFSSRICGWCLSPHLIYGNYIVKYWIKVLYSRLKTYWFTIMWACTRAGVWCWENEEGEYHLSCFYTTMSLYNFNNMQMLTALIYLCDNRVAHSVTTAVLFKIIALLICVLKIPRIKKLFLSEVVFRNLRKPLFKFTH